MKGILNCGRSELRRFSSSIMHQWNESEVLVDRKSKFQARCCAIKSQTEVNNLLQNLVQNNKRIEKASHPHMYAWRTGEVKLQDTNQKKSSASNKKNKKKNFINPKTANIQQGSSDGGEAGAGQRLLTLLEQANVVNVLVIVTRWYGGTPLGSARFRHISSTAVESLRKGGFLS